VSALAKPLSRSLSSAPVGEATNYASLAVTGTLTSDGTTPVVFPTLVFAGMRNGKPEYSSTGIGGGAQPYVAVYSQVGHPAQGWNLYQLTPYAAWFASSIAALPNLASGWTNLGNATGTPAITPL